MLHPSLDARESRGEMTGATGEKERRAREGPCIAGGLNPPPLHTLSSDR
jgi:hypothetical protein